MDGKLCPWDPASFFIISENVAPLIYYSHIPGIIIALIAGFFIFSKNRKSIASKILLFIMLSFAIWGFFDLILWATNSANSVMFLWSMQVLLETLIFSSALLFIKYVADGKGWSFKTSLIITALVLPVILLLPTSLNLSGVYEADCVAIEGPVAVEYVYFLETTFALWIAVFLVRKVREKKKSGDTKKAGELLYIGLGIILFILPFLYGNIIGSITEQWEPAQYGLFGMPIFIGLLAFSMVKFKSFNTKLFSSQVLVFALWILIASILFIRDISFVRIIITITLIISIFFGFLLIRSVSKEIKQRKYIEKLAKDLKTANDRLKALDKQKSEFVSLASHQLRGPLTSIKGYISLILDGDYGDVSKEIKDALSRVKTSTDDLALLVGDYLDVTRIELGRMKYELSTFSLTDLVDEAIGEIRPTIEKAGLNLKVDMDKVPANIHADRNKLKQVILNMLDNAVKYTPEGDIEVSVQREDHTAIVSVKDSGVGIPKDVIPHLFQKFSRAPKASATNISGTGLGLYVAKNIVEEHKGKIWVESEGEGKGSTFSIQLNLV